MIVLDASAVVEMLLGGDRAEAVLPWIEANEGVLHAPALLDVEVAQALRRLVLTRVMSSSRGGAAVEILQDLPVTRHVETALLPRIWELRDRVSAYDGAYVALADALGCPLVTCDAALARAPGLPVEVRVLADRG